MNEITFKTPRLKSGSALWLAINQIKREFRSRKNNSGAKAIIGYLLLALVIIFGCYGMGQLLKLYYSGKFEIGYGFYFAAGKKLFNVYIGLFFMSLMTSFLYFTDRGDLDLLLSSPIEPKKIATARLLVSSFRTTGMFLMFGFMFIGYTAITSHPELFTFVPVAIGLALLEAGFTFILARQILLRLGLAKGRLLSQIIGIGGIVVGMFYLQMSNFGGKTSRHEIFNYHGDYNSFDNFIAFIGHSLLGNWFGAIFIMAFGIIVFLSVMQLIGKSFDKDAANLAGQSLGMNVSKKLDAKTNIKFSKSSIYMLVKKEILSILREPVTLVQIIIPLVAVIPIFAIMFGENGGAKELLFIMPPMIVFVVASITSSIAWMVASVEEARDLLKSSPIGMMQIYIAKAITSLIPATIEIVIFTSILLKLGVKIALMVFVFAMLSSFSMLLIEFTNVRPAKRPKMMQKPDRSIISIIFAMIVMLIWSAASMIAVYSLLWALIPIVIAIAVTFWSIWGNKDGQENYIKSAALHVWSK